MAPLFLALTLAACTKQAEPGSPSGNARQQKRVGAEGQPARPPLTSVMSHAIYAPEPLMAELREAWTDDTPRALHIEVSFCVELTGEISELRVLGEDPAPAISAVVLDAMAWWRFRPILHQGEPMKTCTSKSFSIEMSGAVDAPTGPTLDGFASSGCKKDFPRYGRRTSSKWWSPDDVRAGLKCVRWSPTYTGYRIDLLNFEEACTWWEGQVHPRAQGVDLRLVNPECAFAACGTCLYDWTFYVGMSASEGGDSFSIVRGRCPGESGRFTVEELELALATEPSGERCRYADSEGLEWQAWELHTCGAAYMPCRGQGMCGMDHRAPPCDPGLTCVEGSGEGVQICHVVCRTDAECVPDSQMKCDGAVCRLRSPWLGSEQGG